MRLLLPYDASADADIAALAEEILTAQADGDVQAWIDGALTERAGQSAPDFYITALASQGGYDLSRYAEKLSGVIPALGAAESAASKERCALAWIAASGTVPAECTALLDQNAEALGIMSRVFGLHLVNNGVSSQKYSARHLCDYLLSQQCADGGWALNSPYGDPDVTAMVMQAMAPYRADGTVSPALERGIAFLSEKQLETGAYKSYGTENAESTAQVWIALSALGIDAMHDARFQKNGHTVLDGIMQFRLGAGSYAHIIGGSESGLAVQQICTAYIAAGLSHPVYLLRGEPPALPQIAQTTEAAVTTVTTAAAGSTAAGSSVPHVTQPNATLPLSTAPAGTGSTLTETAAGMTETASAQAESSTAASDTGTTVIDTDTTAFVTGSSYKTLDTELLTTAPPDTPEPQKKYPYRLPMTAGAGMLFAGIAVICFLRGKRSPKTYLTLAAGCGIVIAAVWLIRFDTPEGYYQTETKGGGTVTMEIRCDVICGLPGSEKFPADGVMMQNTEFSIAEGENALTLLYDAVKANRLQIEVDGISGDVVETAYVRGIGSLYELMFGDLSGWTYTVNGERPPVGCGAYTLHDGDRVAWLYTVNL